MQRENALPPLNGHSLYQPRQDGRIFPVEPVFDSPEKHRQHIKERLALACRVFAARGFSYGFAGHISVRDPIDPKLYWTNPMAVHFAQVKVSNLILVDHSGIVVEGDHAVNQAGFILHAAVHEGNPDIVAVCHAHTINGTAFSALGRPLEPYTQDAACFYQNHALVNDEGGAVAVLENQGTGIVTGFKENRAVIHQHHGILTASRHSVDDAAFWFIALDAACKVQLMIEAVTSKAPKVTDARARHSAEHVGSDYIGWLHYQPEADQVMTENPDVFD